MERLSKILLVVCVLFVLVGIYWLYTEVVDKQSALTAKFRSRHFLSLYKNKSLKD